MVVPTRLANRTWRGVLIGVWGRTSVALIESPISIESMPIHFLLPLFLLLPTFQHQVGQSSYTLLGRDPAQGGTTTIPTVLVPVTLSFNAGKPFVMDAAPDVRHVLRSPVFSKFRFPVGGNTQYADAMLRATFPQPEDWHTLLGKPEIKPIKIDIPVGYGYILTSKKSGRSVGIADIEFVQRELFRQLPKQEGKLII